MPESLTDNTSRSWRWLCGILLLALLLRLGAACLLQYLLQYRWEREFLIEGDAEGYWILAQKIVSGEDYSIYTPPRYALRMPGFPLLLAIPISLFGPHLFAARLFLAFVDTFACWLVYLLGKRMFNELTGLMAAYFGAISPAMIGFFSTILSETAFGVTLLWSLLAGHQLFLKLTPAGKSPSVPASPQGLVPVLRNAIWLGVSLAAGVMMRPSWILAAPIVAILLWVTTHFRKRAMMAGGVTIIAMVLILLPWGIRNLQVTGHFTLTTFWMGPSLYDGLNPQATGDSNMKFYDQDNLNATMGEYEVDQHYRSAAWQYAADHPRHALELAVHKAARYWSPWPNAAQFGNFWLAAALTLYTVPIFILSACGLFSVAKCSQITPTGDWGGRIWAMAILSGPVLYFFLIHLFFVSSLRYRLPAEYPLLVLAATGALQLWSRRRLNPSRQ